MPLEITLEVETQQPVDVITSVMRGPAGSPGPDGAPGPTGPQGPQGPPGSGSGDGFAYDVTLYAPPETPRDGTVDWRPYIQTAIDACAAAGGGIVDAPPGLYTVGYGLHVKSGVWLRGHGIGITTIKLADNGALGLTTLQIQQHLGCVLSLYQAQKARVSDLTVDGNQDNNRGQDPTLDVNEASRLGGIYVGGRYFSSSDRAADCVLENLHVTEAASEGIEVSHAARCWVRNCRSDYHGGIGGTDPPGSWMSNAIIIGIYANDCHIIECTGGEGCWHGGFEIFTGGLQSGLYDGENTIERCRTNNIILNTSSGPRTFQWTRIVDNHIDTTKRNYGNGGHGIIMIGNPSMVLIEGNTIRYHNGQGITNSGNGAVLPGDPDNAWMMVIANNVIEWAEATPGTGVQGNGIAIVTTDDLVITGNTIRAWGNGIRVVRCGGATITGNTMVGWHGTVTNYWAPNDGSREGSSGMDWAYHPLYGVMLEKVRDSIVSNNVMRGYRAGGVVEDAGIAGESKISARNMIARNNFFNNWISVWPDSAAPTSIWADNVMRPDP
jgi:hypothetical protein